MQKSSIVIFVNPNLTRLDREKMLEAEDEFPNKNKHPKNNQFGSRSLDMRDIHVFWDANLLGTYAVPYAVIRQPSRTKQELIVSKTRLSKKKLAILRLELVAVQKVANLADNIRNYFPNYNIREVYGWSNSTILLHWLQDNGSFS